MSEPTPLTASLEAEAFTLIKAGEFSAALVLIEAAPDALRDSESISRVHALALAQTGRVLDALAKLTPHLDAPNVSLQTRSLAARLFEDDEQSDSAFAQYVVLSGALPGQIGFWRGLWRTALALRNEQMFRRAHEHSQRLQFDVASDATAAIAFARLARRFAARADIDTCADTISRAADAFAADDQLRWLHTMFAIDALPLTAASRVAPPAKRLTSADQISAALRMPSLYRDDSAIEGWRERYAAGLSAIERSCAEAMLPPSTLQFTAFTLAYHGRSNLTLQTKRGDLLSRMVAAHAPPPRSDITDDATRIRLGFVSKHIRDCTVGQYFKRFMMELRDERIAIEVFALGQTDSLTDEIEHRVDRLHRIALASGDDDSDRVLGECAREIAARSFDVLIYPEVGMEPLIEKLAAIRLAPLQCALWGHPDTTGLPTIDVFFSAESMEPASAQTHYRERLQLLPNLGCAYPKPPAPSSVTRAALGLPNDTPLLVCAQSSFKWRAQFVDVVARVLRALPRAKFVYFENRDAVAAYAFEQFLFERLHNAGIDPAAQTIALRETSREDFLATLSHCDIALDTFDFSGGNTTLDSLSVGLPVVTLPGEFMRGRQSMAMLERVGANELIARDVDDYVKIACSLIDDKPRREVLRAALIAKSHALFDDPAPIAALRKWILKNVNQQN